MTPDADGLNDFDAEMLRDAAVSQDIGVAYGLARRHFPGADVTELHRRIRASLLTLLDAGLIVFFKAPLEEGYSLGPEDVSSLSRHDVVADLDLGPDHIPDESSMLFFVRVENPRSS